MSQTATKSEIQSTAIYKISGQSCWYVPSDSSEKMYKVCFDEQSNNWSCECKCGEISAARGMTCNCKHVRAVMTSIQANKVEQERAEFAAKVAEAEAAQAAEDARYRAEKERRETEAYERRMEQKRQEQQRKHQEEAEKRAAFVAAFDPCGLGW